MSRAAFAALVAVACRHGVAPLRPTDARRAVEALVEQEVEAFAGGAPWQPLAAKDALISGWRGERARVAVHGLSIGVAPDGRAAWLSAEIRGSREPLRLTEVVALTGDRWQVVAAQLSAGVPSQAALTTPSMAATVAPAAADLEIVEVFDQHLLDPAFLSERDDTIVIGSAPGEIAVGAAAIRDGLDSLSWLHPTLTRRGPARVRRVGPDLACVAATVDLDITDPDSTSHTVPMRVLAVYLREAQDWRLVQAHYANDSPSESIEVRDQP